MIGEKTGGKGELRPDDTSRLFELNQKIFQEYFVPGLRGVILEEVAKFERRMACLEKELESFRNRIWHVEKAVATESRDVIRRLLELAGEEKKP